MSEYELKMVKGALAALSQKSTFPADVVYAKKILKELVAAQQGVQPTLLTLCPECGVEQIVTHLPTCAHYVAQRG
jgi:hypothetical protein